jgi:hypothetical protein
MAGVGGAVLESVATTPEVLAVVLNALHDGPLADADAEDVVHEVLGAADADVVTLTGGGVFVADALPRCVLLLSRDDAWRLCGVTERLVGAAMELSERASNRATVCRDAISGGNALLASLDVFAWGARVSVTIADGDVVVSDEPAVGAGTPRAAVASALMRLIDGSSGLFAAALGGVDALGVLRHRVELVSVSRLAREGGAVRTVTVRLVAARLDDDTVAMLEDCEDDEVTRVELFDSVAQSTVDARVLAWPTASDVAAVR